MSLLSRIYIVLFMFVGGGAMLASAHGVEVNTLYQTSVQVKDRSNGERARAIKQGFSRILVRVSGSSALAQQPELLQEKAKAEQYLTQFGYESRQTPSSEDLDQPTKSVFLNVKYDALAINQLLRRNGYPIWASNRPQMVIWAALDAGSGRQLVGNSRNSSIQALIEALAEDRGLPVVVPKYDQEDLNQVSAGDIWGMFVKPIDRASQRYQADVILLAKIRQSNGSARINAMLKMDQQQHWFEQKSDNLAEATAQIMTQVSDKVGEHYAVVSSTDLGQQLVLQVTSVTQLKDFADLGQYLDSVLAIRSAQLQHIQGADVRYLLTLESSEDALQQSFRLDSKLAPIEREPSIASESVSDGAELNPIQEPEKQQEPGQQRIELSPVPVLNYQWVGS